MNTTRRMKGGRGGGGRRGTPQDSVPRKTLSRAMWVARNFNPDDSFLKVQNVI